MKLDAVTVPSGVVKTIGPLVAEAGTWAETCESEATVNFAATPLNVTEVVPERCVPLIVTYEPTFPPDGEEPVTLGGARIVKLSVPAAVPDGVVTRIGPLAAVAGTCAVS